MSGVRQGSHLDHLLELRDRVDAEIATERTRMAAADARRAEQAAAAAREAAEAARLAEKEADRAARRDAARAETEALEAAAPTETVRAWAREQGIAVGDRGRIAVDLRRQYLAATQEAAS
jgi:hypothetical protein